MNDKNKPHSSINHDKLVNNKSDFFVDALHIFVLSGFALAQPLFDLLSKHAGFFVSRKSEPIDIILLILILCVGLPAIAVLIEGVFGLFGRRFRKAIHWFMVATLLAVITLQVLKKFLESPGIAVIVIAAVLGVAGTVAYIRFHRVRMYMTALSPAILIFPALFLFNSPVFKLVFPDKDASAIEIKIDDPPSIIMVVFDEFPVTSLMDENYEIDPVRYPNLSALAREAYWFRNAVTVRPTTHLAIPAILTGSYPDHSSLPILSSYPNNLFTLLGGSYEMIIYEMETMLSPKISGRNDKLHETLLQRLPSLLLDSCIVYLHIISPPDVSSRLPVVTQTWKNFLGEGKKDVAKSERSMRRKGSVSKRVELYAEFVEAISISDEPALYFFHSMLPHVPWDRLPSGKRYKKKGLRIPGLNIKQEKWYEDDWLVTQAYQRHLLQVGFVDKLVGALINRLKDLKIYDRFMIIITADHGANFRPGRPRRSVLKDDPMGVLGVPLIIKVPNQKEGKIIDRYVETIDILPTIADILNLSIPFKIDGLSVFDPLGNAELFTDSYLQHFLNPIGANKPLINKHPSLERKVYLFGSRNLDGLFKIGTYKNLVGQSIRNFKIPRNESVTIDLDHKQEVYEFVDCKAEFMPATHVTGKINFKRVADLRLHLAVVINGTIRAVTRTFVNNKDEVRFTALVPESAFLMRGNHVEILIVSVDENGQPLLSRPKSRRQVTYSLSRSGEKLIRHPDGVSIAIVSNGFDGRVKSRVRANNIYMSGWAADIKNSRVPDAVVMLENDKFFSSEIPKIVRRDVAKYFDNQALKMTGFEFVFPSSYIKDTATYRFFAVFDDIASELKYPKGYKWKKDSSGT